MSIRALISDFGGVLTTPLTGGFERLREHSGISPEQFGTALATRAATDGENPLFALEAGRIGEPAFLEAISETLTDQLGHPAAFEHFGEVFLAGLSPNEPFIEYLRGVRGRGLRLAICTNNVREWSQRWQAMIPAGELFELIVDSSEAGVRKPDPRIYELTLSELGLSAAETVFVDDLEGNAVAADGLGMHPVWFRDTEQAIADVEALLAREC